MKRTYKPSKKSRQTTHGFRKRSASKGGKKVLKARRAKEERESQLYLQKKGIIGSQSYPDTFRIKQRREFLYLKDRGKRFYSKNFVYLTLKNTLFT